MDAGERAGGRDSEVLQEQLQAAEEKSAALNRRVGELEDDILTAREAASVTFKRDIIGVCEDSEEALQALVQRVSAFEEASSAEVNVLVLHSIR